MKIDLSDIDEKEYEKYLKEFEGYEKFKDFWYIKREGNLIQLKLDVVGMAENDL